MWELSVLSARGCWEPQAALRSQGYYEKHVGAPRRLAEKPSGVSRRVEGQGLCGDHRGHRWSTQALRPSSPTPCTPVGPRTGGSSLLCGTGAPSHPSCVPFLALPTVGRELSGDLFHSPHFYRAPTTCWALAQVLGLHTPGKQIPCPRGTEPHPGKRAIPQGGVNIRGETRPMDNSEGGASLEHA